MFANGFMGIKTIDECFYYIQNGANIKQAENSGGYPITRIETTSNDRFNRDRMGYAGITDLAKYSTYILEDDDLLMSHINSVRYLGRTVLYKKIGDEIIIHGMNLLRLKADKSIILPKYAKYYFYSYNFRSQLANITKKSVNQASFAVKDLKRIKIDVPQLENQKIVINTLDKLQSIITHIRTQLEKLDLLVKARFVEMFGDFKVNPKKWCMAKFSDIAKIDGNMTTDFKKYANYPHIGIDSIEKETGRLIGYRTVSQDNVTSGKYVFTSNHIIYSKIRPNLNKVALPDFEGVCSADAYPILPLSNKCNRIFLAYVLRSEYFLDYILQFCSRTNLPKVNRKEVSGFVTPLPPIELQTQFADFVKQVDQSKSILQQELTQTQTLFDSLMQEYFG